MHSLHNSRSHLIEKVTSDHFTKQLESLGKFPREEKKSPVILLRHLTMNISFPSLFLASSCYLSLALGCSYALYTITNFNQIFIRTLVFSSKC